MSGRDPTELSIKSGRKSALEKEIEYFRAQMERHPWQNAIDGGEPLMVVFTGAAQDPAVPDNPLWQQGRETLKTHLGLSEKDFAP